MARRPAFSAGLGVAAGRATAGSGPGCRGRELDAPLGSEGVRRVHARPYSPRRNGKVERANRALTQGRRCGGAREGGAGRASALPAFIERYNRERPHGACGGLPPMSRIADANNLLAHNT